MFELGTDGPTSIIAGVDGSQTSLRAAAYAWGLARRQGAHLIVVYVSGTGGLGATAAGGAALVREAADQVVADLRASMDDAARHGPVSHTLISQVGDPYTVLARVADDNRADLVVVGASTKAGHRFVGSVALRLVRTGRWPVTVVP